MSNVDKKLEEAIIQELVLLKKVSLEDQKELPSIIEAECESMEQVLSKGCSRELIRTNIIENLSDKEKVIYLEYLSIQPKLIDLSNSFTDELVVLLTEEVVEQSDYSEAKQNKQFH